MKYALKKRGPAMNKTFIPKHKYNHIKKCLRDLNNTFRNCTDNQIIATHKASLQDTILNLFDNLSEEQTALLDILKITDSLSIDQYLADLEEYVYGIVVPTSSQIKKVFRKEKKLKLPLINEENPKLVYLGWLDESIRKLFITYPLEDKLIGMACRIPNQDSNNTHICTFCNHVGKEDEVAFVSPICKTAHDEYRSIGFHMCLDSAKCNERIISTEKLEKILKDVNHLN